MIRLGLIVNPIAGLGGSVGLKGTDGVAAEALRRGAVKHAAGRTQAALKQLLPMQKDLLILCPSGEMGEAEAAALGFSKEVILSTGETTDSSDTIAAARAMKNIDLLLFSGGDGTARDLVRAGCSAPVIGIPAGVKIHSPVYAVRPEAAGQLALRYLRKERTRLSEREVVDIDEDLCRRGSVITKLYGTLITPEDVDFLQHGKASSPISDHGQQRLAAAEMLSRMEPDVPYLIGPGTTLKTLMDELGLPDTLLGFDLIRGGQLVQSDLCEADILSALSGTDWHLVLTPTGGQGYLLGRGNQQISPAVLKTLDRKHLHIISTKAKLLHLDGRPLLIDTGDPGTDAAFNGYYRVIVGLQEEQMVPVKGDLS